MRVPIEALITTLAVIAVERSCELWLSWRHERALRARGGVEFGRAHFLGFVLLHVGYPIAMAVEVIRGGARPFPYWPALVPAIVLAHVLRFTAIAALGDRWHTRVWVVPGEPPVRRGIYRWLRHPNYVAVVVECAAIPLAFGAWRTAIAASAFNAVMLAVRIRVEERALDWATHPVDSGAPAGASN